MKKQANTTDGDAAIREILARIIQATTSNAALRDDLMQEALIHIWLMQSRRPGQTRSWYLQSCKFHLRHYLTSGRSIDSGKRRVAQLDFPRNNSLEELLELPDSGDSVFTWVSARDLLSVLSRYLLPQEKGVLDGLADGLAAREIGRKLNLSHTTVIKHRRKIATLLARLELFPASKPGAVLANGSGHLIGTHISNWPGLSNDRPTPHAVGKC